MHICFVSNLYPPYVIGGAEVYLQNLVRILSAEHQVTVISTCPFEGLNSLSPSLVQEGNVDVYRFYPVNLFHLTRRPKSPIRKGLWYLFDVYNHHTRRTVHRILETDTPDVVHTHNLRGLSVSVWDAVKELGLPLVHTLHDCHLICRNSLLMHGKDGKLCDGKDLECRLYRPTMKRLVDSKPDLVLSPSEFVMKQHVQAGLFADSQRAILRLWSDPPDPTLLKPGKRHHGLRVIYMGAVSGHKGVRYLVKGFRKLSDPQASLEIIGAGDQELEICRAIAAGDDRIVFTGFVSGAEKEQAFARADVLVLPSICFENAPVVISESFVHGIPVVASRIGGIPELVNHLDNGLLCEPRSVDELAQCLQTLSSDRTLLKHLGENAKVSGSKTTARTHVAQLVDLYQSVEKQVAGVNC